jgi:hypothetical protein
MVSKDCYSFVADTSVQVLSRGPPKFIPVDTKWYVSIQSLSYSLSKERLGMKINFSRDD